MTRKSTYILSGVIYFIFFTSILYFFISIGTSIKGEKTKAAFSFNAIVQDINDYVNSTYSNEEFDIDLIASNYLNLKTLRIEKDNTLYYEYKSINPEANKISTTKVFSRTIPYLNNSTAVLTAEYQILKPETIYNSARKVFIIILTATIITLILILTSKKESKSSIKVRNISDTQNSERDFAADSLTQKDENKDYEWSFNLDNAETEIEPEPETEHEAKTSFVTENQDTKETADISFAEKSVESENPALSNIIDTNEIDSIFNNDDFENYLNISLQNSTENEQDLSLVIIKFEFLNNTIIASLKDTLLNVTNQKNIFNFEKNSLALIINDIDIDEAVLKAQNLYNDINDKLVENNIDGCFAIGLTSKSLRMVSAQRLINEADQAVERAFNETELPIVAFKVNPDKYREHISSI